MTPLRFDHDATRLDSASALEVLEWAVERFGPRLTFATGFGAEGCALIDLIGRHHLPIDLFTLDTGVLFPETYALWRRLEEKYSLRIRRVRPAAELAEEEAVSEQPLWERDSETCCHLRKVLPLRRALRGFDAWITAIRRDQTPARANAPVVGWDEQFGLAKVNPLVRWTVRDVWRHLLDHDVPYNPLHDAGFPSIGCQPCTSAVLPGEDPRAGRWRGRSKTECGLHTPIPVLLHVGGNSDNHSENQERE